MSQSSLTEGVVWRRLLTWLSFSGRQYPHIVFCRRPDVGGKNWHLCHAGLGMAHAALMLGFAALLGPAIGTLGGVAQAVGAGDSERADIMCAQGFLVSLVVGLVFACSAFFVPTLPEFMEAGDALSGDVQGAQDYLRISLFGLMLNAPLFVLTLQSRALEMRGQPSRSSSWPH